MEENFCMIDMSGWKRDKSRNSDGKEIRAGSGLPWKGIGVKGQADFGFDQV